MARNYADWLKAYCEFTSHLEAPRRMHFWTGIWTIAAALRRRVWIDQKSFVWIPNFYIIFVAPPEVVAKSTTAGIGKKLLMEVPGVHFGPDIATWESLPGEFAKVAEEFEFEGDYYPQAPLSFCSGELGNLFDPGNRHMVDFYVNLWDGGPLKKVTKTSGDDFVNNPYANIIACTTPDWIAGAFPEYTIGGGFTSRAVFIYAEEKEKLVAYPGLVAPHDYEDRKRKLIEDLKHIALRVLGPYTITPEAIAWGTQWYEDSYHAQRNKDERDRVKRKQTQVHKIAMILAASQRDERFITLADLQAAVRTLDEVEIDMRKVFSKVGRSQLSINAERFVNHVQRCKVLPYEVAYKRFFNQFPNLKEFEAMVSGAIRAGYIRNANTPKGIFLVSNEEPANVDQANAAENPAGNVHAGNGRSPDREESVEPAGHDSAHSDVHPERPTVL